MSYVGVLVGAVAAGTLAAKLHKVVGDAGHQAGALDLAAVVSSDVLMLSLWAVFWAWALHASRGRLRGLLAGVLQATTALIMLFLVVEHAFYLVTGSLLDWNLLRYTAEHLERLKGVISSEMGTASWLGLAGAVIVALLPALLLRGLDRAPATRPPLTRRAAVVTGVTLLAIWGAHLGLRTHKLPSGLQPLRANPLTEHVADGVLDLLGGDNAGAGGRRALHPLEPLVVVRGQDTRPYNVVLIVLESVRANVLTPYNPTLQTTPFLARLAGRGMLAEQAYTVIPHTTKSLVPLHCGIYPKITPRFEEATEGAMPSDCLARVLRRQGYATHFIQSPESVFERRRDLVRIFGFERMSAKEELPSEGFEKVGYFGYEDDVMIQPTLRWVDEQKGRPFFLGMLNATSHHPYEVPRDFKTPQWPIKGKISKYFDSLLYTDRFLEQLFEGFEKRGLFDNTIFIIAGDHGEGFGEHGRSAHDQIMHEEGIQVPLLMAGVGIPKGLRLKGLRQHVDVVPTVLELLKLKVVAGDLPGVSLMDAKGHDTLFYSCWRDDRCAALRQGPIKTISYYGKRDPQVYDLEKDPEEKADLYGQGAHTAEAVKPRIAAIAAWKEDVNGRFQAQSLRRKHPFVSDTAPDDLGTPVNITFDRFVRLIGYKIEHNEVAEGDATWVTCHFEVLQQPKPGWLLWMHATGPDVRGRGHNLINDHVPVEGSYPIDEWKEGQFITDRHWLRIPPGYPSGEYDVRFGFYREKDSSRAGPHGEGLPLTSANAVHLGTLKVVNKERPEEPPYALLTPELKRMVKTEPLAELPGGVTAVFGDAIKLAGVLPGERAIAAGQSTTWTWYLQILKTPPRWTDIFVHVEGPVVGDGFADGKRSYINAVHRPLPKGPDIGRWPAGWTVIDRHTITVPAHFRPGRYRIMLGFWDPNLDTADRRLPVHTEGVAEANRLEVGTLVVREKSTRPPKPRAPAESGRR